MSSKWMRVRIGPVRNGEPARTHSVLYSPIMVSANALSSASPTVPTDGTSPSSISVSVKCIAVYWVNSTGRRNTSMMEVLMGRPAGWMKELTGRSPMKSPGAPSHRREVQRQFWGEIARGLLPEEAARVVGVSQAVGTRWFRHGGGMPRFSLKPLSGRYLSFAEREEIALRRAQGAGVRQIGRELSRAASTISRELRRNAATRSGALVYRASVAQWKAELVAQRPKTAKLVTNPNCANMFRNDCLARSAFVTERWQAQRHDHGQDATSPTEVTGDG